LADWYLEVAKIEKDKDELLLYILRNLLILWHPFVPFVTEEIWSSFNDDLLMVKKWPEAQLASKSDSVKNFELIKELIIAIRNARSENKIEPAQKLQAIIQAGKQEKLIMENSQLIKGLRTNLETIEINNSGKKIENAINVIFKGMEICLVGEINKDKEKARLLKEKENLEKLIIGQKNKLANQDFVKLAPEKIVNAEKTKLTNYEEALDKINQTISKL